MRVMTPDIWPSYCWFLLTEVIVNQFVHHFGPDSNISWIAMKFGTDIHGTQRMNLNDFGDLPDFLSHANNRSNSICWHMMHPNDLSSSATMRFTFLFFSEISQ